MNELIAFCVADFLYIFSFLTICCRFANPTVGLRHRTDDLLINDSSLVSFAVFIREIR